MKKSILTSIWKTCQRLIVHKAKVSLAIVIYLHEQMTPHSQSHAIVYIIRLLINLIPIYLTIWFEIEKIHLLPIIEALEGQETKSLYH